ncbi:hypothetical protein HOK51_01200 [Candidatus Woesearchaeota archaeon]|jgi:hypothetical protein|nr:hypothetical protein [Candidatus Woesearchaeota archaeon]MBT7366580.1 hypothetical protein [Candidatus Woesearchaeota archaeon]
MKIKYDPSRPRAAVPLDQVDSVKVGTCKFDFSKLYPQKETGADEKANDVGLATKWNNMILGIAGEKKPNKPAQPKTKPTSLDIILTEDEQKGIFNFGKEPVDLTEEILYLQTTPDSLEKKLSERGIFTAIFEKAYSKINGIVATYLLDKGVQDVRMNGGKVYNFAALYAEGKPKTKFEMSECILKYLNIQPHIKNLMSNRINLKLFQDPENPHRYISQLTSTGSMDSRVLRVDVLELNQANAKIKHINVYEDKRIGN